MTIVKEDHFSLAGGARVNLMNASFPFARLLVYRKGRRLSCLGREYFFGRDRIAALSKYRGLFSTGLRIHHHTVPVYPDFIVFWVSVFLMKSRFASLQERLSDFGYEVSP